MNKYLPVPCPYCKQMTLQQPVKNKNRWYSLCAECDRKALYIIHDKVDGGKSFEVKAVGAVNHDMVRATFWIRRDQKERLVKESILPRMQSQVVRAALDKELGT